MREYRVRALSLRKTRLGESDVIVTLLAEDGCRISAVAKGARKPGSRFGARVEPYSIVDVMLHRGRTLDVITDVATVMSHQAIREDYDRSLAASVAVDFLDKSSLECQTDERLFGLATATLDAIEQARETDLPALVVAFLVKGMAMQGYRPQFDACASCGGRVPASETAFDLESGGPLCAECAGGVTSAIVASSGARAALRALLGARMAAVAGLGVPQSVVAECFAIMHACARCHVPARLKALDVYAAQTPRVREG
jgi:DNA repair protein RecO (recombination protein O)